MTHMEKKLKKIISHTKHIFCHHQQSVNSVIQGLTFLQVDNGS